MLLRNYTQLRQFTLVVDFSLLIIMDNYVYFKKKNVIRLVLLKKNIV